ncbi:MAG: Eco57I restriction-modification methylase domain-containing protein [Solirubrobacteraceae bacterium]
MGLAEGLPKDQWRLKPAADLLRLTVCDMAMGSGAFLVQACRYLSERLVEAWEAAETAAGGRVVVTPEGDLASGAPDEQPLPRDAEERLAVARRVVSDRCLYGVDKNRLAVEMGKLSLWLVTLQKDRPFTFLDHRLRCGDSLLGVDLKQLYGWSLKQQEMVRLPWVQPFVQRALDRSLALRARIAATTVVSLRDAAEKTRLLAEAEQATELVRLGADLLVASALDANPKRRELLRQTLLTSYEIEALAEEEHERHPFRAEHRAAGIVERTALRARADELLGDHRPFHWPLEFPEIFIGPKERGEAAGFAAMIGNPPFLGGQKITGALGVPYRDYLVEFLAHGVRGSADLCAYFFLRAHHLVRHDGDMGLLATNTIAQGGTREVGLEQLTKAGDAIVRAIPSRKWPGEANLEVAHLWLRKGEWRDGYVLDEQPVGGISAFLTVPSRAQGNPYRLAANAGKSFQGSIVLGMGFVLEPEEALALIAKDPRSREVLFPYLNGEDLNSRPDQSPSRWVINFHDWPLERAESYPDCMRIVREKVKPKREEQNDEGGKQYWWRFLRPRPELHEAIAGMERVLVLSIVTQYFGPAFCPNGWVYAHRCCVFPLDEWGDYSVVQSTIHEVWARQYSSSLESRLNYSPTDCFETFPLPFAQDCLVIYGERYVTHRNTIANSRQEGTTKVYQRFHSSEEASPDIARLRELHAEMDRAVADAYGWSDLDLGHGFHETKQGRRFTISEVARREVLDRLLALNHARYAEEVAAGLHEKGKAGSGRKAGMGRRSGQMALDGGAEG